MLENPGCTVSGFFHPAHRTHLRLRYFNPSRKTAIWALCSRLWP
jgi:hypothetical protein